MGILEDNQWRLTKKAIDVENSIEQNGDDPKDETQG